MKDDSECFLSEQVNLLLHCSTQGVFSQQSQAVCDMSCLLLEFSFSVLVQQSVGSNSRSGDSSGLSMLTSFIDSTHMWVSLHPAKRCLSAPGSHHRAGKGLWWFAAILWLYMKLKGPAHLIQKDVLTEALNVETELFLKNICFDRIPVKMRKAETQKLCNQCWKCRTNDKMITYILHHYILWVQATNLARMLIFTG